MKQPYLVGIIWLLLLGTTVFAQQPPLVSNQGNTLAERTLLPAGYKRLLLNKESFGNYLRNISLLPPGTRVHYYDGTVKENNGIYVAVVNLDIGHKDLQQCADVIMHVRADYLYNTNQKEKISFNFTNGFKASYAEWMKGNRIKVAGNKVSWVKTAAPGDNADIYRQYMDVVYNYAGTLSLSKELQPIKLADIQPGDVFIKGGSPGHAELVMDVAVNNNGQKIFLLAQSYMPAQQMQILANPGNKALSPWYQATGTAIVTPEWDFTSGQLMRFK